MSQRIIANGVQLDFENAVNSDLTVYNCYEAHTKELVTINVTDGKWNEHTQMLSIIHTYICFFEAACIFEMLFYGIQ